MVRLKQYRPAFIDIDEPLAVVEAESFTLADLAAIPWIARWMEMPDFHQLSQTPMGSYSAVMAELDGGKHWVLGHADAPFPDLPEWKRHDHP